MLNGRLGREAAVCSWPAIVVATVTLLPFLNTPFTIDDPIFIAQAQHVLTDPLHPQAFFVVWARDIEVRESASTPSNIAGGYIMVPSALAGSKEWVAHLTQIAFLALGLFGTALVGLRLGFDRWGTKVAVLLTGTAPAVLGMAGTAMPDVATMTYTVLGMERLLAWRDERKWHQALAAMAWLTLAPLTRLFTIGLLLPALVFLLDGITAKGVRSSWRSGGIRFAPVLGVPLAYLLTAWITADPLASVESTDFWMVSFKPDMLVRNSVAYLIHWSLVAPLALPWLALRWHDVSRRVVVIVLICASVLAWRMGWPALAAAPGAIVLWDILSDALHRRDREQFALGLWLLPALLAVIYTHVAAKYMAPLIPAAAILVVRELRGASPAWRRWLPAAMATAGLLSGLLVLAGTRELAQAQYRAVQELVVPRMQSGERVWVTGGWGFQWYAERAGAKPAVVEGNLPQAGDVIVVSRAYAGAFQSSWTRKRVIDQLAYPGRIRVCDGSVGAGYFGNEFGYLPWVWNRSARSIFEVWRVE